MVAENGFSCVTANLFHQTDQTVFRYSISTKEYYSEILLLGTAKNVGKFYLEYSTRADAQILQRIWRRRDPQ